MISVLSLTQTFKPKLTSSYYNAKKWEKEGRIYQLLGVNLIKFGFVRSLWLLILNLILNIYPIIVQRYNRPRLKRAINMNKVNKQAM